MAHHIRLKTPIMPTIQNLIDKITAQLTNVQSDKITTYTGRWDNPPSAPTNADTTPITSIANDTSSGSQLGDIVKFAVYSKWKTDSHPGQALKIKGQEMVKFVTGLDPE
jgi:hypothetical protein